MNLDISSFKRHTWLASVSCFIPLDTCVRFGWLEFGWCRQFCQPLLGVFVRTMRSLHNEKGVKPSHERHARFDNLGSLVESAPTGFGVQEKESTR